MQRLYVAAVIIDGVIWATSLIVLSILAKRAPTGSFREHAIDALEWSWFAFGALFLAGLLIMVAQRRQDQSWSFCLAVAACALMGCAGMCASVLWQ